MDRDQLAAIGLNYLEDLGGIPATSYYERPVAEYILSRCADAGIDVRADRYGNILATDDDGGTGLNSRIDRALTAGTYEIVASSFSAGQTGTYQLTVDVPPPATTAAVGTDRTRAPGPKLRPASDSGTEQLRRLRIEYQARRTEAMSWGPQSWRVIK